MSTDKSAYISAEIEIKWQEFWDKNKTFKTGEDQKKSKFYALDMFPYPSGAGLHVGHPEGYIASDIISRYKRMNNFNVLHPMGWDAFGLPAEQYAVETGTHPKETTKKNIKTFKRQIKSLGFSYDWDREINTTDEKYYKWTQWIFTQLYKKGLAYIDYVEVNWCPALGTVLANEEVINGLSERGSHPVVRKPMKQWVLKITEYADRLLDDIDDLDWPVGIKEMQRNWIGKSIGAEVDFNIKDTNHKLTVYTTRPDTLFGATYMVMSPEHPLVREIMSNSQKSKIQEYIKNSSTKSELARTEDKEKTGVFTGAYALNPVNEEEIPIWISDYVLISYGTGAIMAVPAHDTRDFEFAQKFDIPIKCIIEPNTKEAKAENADTAKILAGQACWTGNGRMINSANSANLDINNMNVKESKKATIDWLTKRNLGREAINFKLRDWIFSRQRYWGEPFPIAHMEDGSIKVLDEKDLPVVLPEMGADYRPSDSGESPLAKASDWLDYTDPKTGMKGRRETNTMPQWAGSCWYYLRYIDNENNEQGWAPDKEKYWMPVDLYIGGAEHAVLHLLYARFWHKVLFDLGFVSTKEPFQKLFNQGMILGLSYRNDRGVIIPNDKVKNDKGQFLHTETGEKLEEFPAKMSKSLKNVVNPDEIIAQYGADSMRLYEMFMGPLEATKPWNTNGVEGVARFLHKTWRMIIGKDGKPAEKFTHTEMNEEHNRLLHKTIKKVTEDIETFNFNTAISQMMIFVNEVNKAESFSIDGIQSFIKLLSPYAPHMCEELWERFGYSDGISYEPWPKFDKRYLHISEVEILVQLLGKPVAKLIVPTEIDKKSLEKLALENSSVQEKIANKTVHKVIVVPGRLVNIVAN